MLDGGVSTLFSRLSLVFAGILLCLGIVAIDYWSSSQPATLFRGIHARNQSAGKYVHGQPDLPCRRAPDKQVSVDWYRERDEINPSLMFTGWIPWGASPRPSPQCSD
jgi:hypothetical protein